MSEIFTIKDYVVNSKRIGKGSFADVFKGYNRLDRKVVAIKRIDTSRLKNDFYNRLDDEINLMKTLKNKYIVELYDVIYDNDNNYVYLVIEYCSGGDLSGIFNNICNENVVQRYFKQISKGLKYLRSKNIIHRDLKPQNMLLSSKRDDAVIKITDFGFAKILSINEMTETICGSPYYMAPEILKKQNYTNKADLWSLGIILYEALIGRHPFKVNNIIDLIKNIDKVDYIEVSHDIINKLRLSTSVVNLINSLLIKNDVDRLDWDDFFEHEWFVSNLNININNSILNTQFQFDEDNYENENENDNENENENRNNKNEGAEVDRNNLKSSILDISHYLNQNYIKKEQTYSIVSKSEKENEKRRENGRKGENEMEKENTFKSEIIGYLNTSVDLLNFSFKSLKSI
jgi:serine/threonine protein kinase